MASPVDDFYSTTSGGTITGGRPLNDVVDDVWTPTKDGSGVILAASRASLPLNRWCKVAGTKLSQVAAAIAASGFVMASDNLGSNKDVTSALVTWEGHAFNKVKGHSTHLVGGGHSNSSMNAVFRLELDKMGGDAGWRLLWAPSRPNAAGAPWSSEYKAGIASDGATNYQPFSSFPVEYQSYAPSAGGISAIYDVLPDQTPTSRHTYGDMAEDRDNNIITLGRIQRWDFDIAKAEAGVFPWSHQRWYHTQTGAYEPTDTGSFMFWHPGTGTIQGGLPRMNGGNESTYSWKVVEEGSNVLTAKTPICGMGKVGACPWGDDDDRILICYDNDEGSGVKVVRYNMQTGYSGSGVELFGQITTAQATGEMDLPSLCYIPEWGKAIWLAGTTGVWQLLDPVALTSQAYSPAGLLPTFLVGGAPSYPGNKLFYFPRWKCVIYIAPRGDDTDAVYIMRVG